MPEVLRVANSDVVDGATAAVGERRYDHFDGKIVEPIIGKLKIKKLCPGGHVVDAPYIICDLLDDGGNLLREVWVDRVMVDPTLTMDRNELYDHYLARFHEAIGEQGPATKPIFGLLWQVLSLLRPEDSVALKLIANALEQVTGAVADLAATLDDDEDEPGDDPPPITFPERLATLRVQAEPEVPLPSHAADPITNHNIAAGIPKVTMTEFINLRHHEDRLQGAWRW